jgi:hypothetical protein
LPADRSADWRRVLKAIEGNRNFVFPALGCVRFVAAKKLRTVCRLVRVAPRFRLGSLRKIRFARRGAPPIRPRPAARGASARVTAIGSFPPSAMFLTPWRISRAAVSD